MKGLGGHCGLAAAGMLYVGLAAQRVAMSQEALAP